MVSRFKCLAWNLAQVQIKDLAVIEFLIKNQTDPSILWASFASDFDIPLQMALLKSILNTDDFSAKKLLKNKNSSANAHKFYISMMKKPRPEYYLRSF